MSNIRREDYAYRVVYRDEAVMGYYRSLAAARAAMIRGWKIRIDQWAPIELLKVQEYDYHDAEWVTVRNIRTVMRSGEA